MRARVKTALGRHGRFVSIMAVVVALLAATNVLHKYGPAGFGLVLGPVVAATLILLARRSGLSWHDLGLSRRTLIRGAGYAACAVALVAAVYAVAAALPLTRTAFLDTRYQMALGQALFTALVSIPFGTVLLEEIAFRGVLQGLVTRHRGRVWGLSLSAVLFGGWHVLPSLNLSRANPAVSGIAGSGQAAQVAVVLAAVVFTAGAGVLLGELRRRSGSLVAAAGLHWAVNALAVLVAAAIRSAA